MENRLLAELLLTVTLRFMRLIKVAFAGGGAEGSSVSPTQYRELARLRERDAPVTELADCQAVSLPTTTKILDGLVERGWVERGRSESDRRQVIVSLSSAGAAVFSEVTERALLSLQGLLAELDAERIAEVGGALGILAELLVSPRGTTQATASPDSGVGQEP